MFFSKLKSVVLLTFFILNLNILASENNPTKPAQVFDSVYIDPAGKVDLEHRELTGPKPIEWIDLTKPQEQVSSAKPQVPAAPNAKVDKPASAKGQVVPTHNPVQQRTSLLSNDGNKTANTVQPSKAQRGKQYRAPIDVNSVTTKHPQLSQSPAGRNTGYPDDYFSDPFAPSKPSANPSSPSPAQNGAAQVKPAVASSIPNNTQPLQAQQQAVSQPQQAQAAAPVQGASGGSSMGDTFKTGVQIGLGSGLLQRFGFKLAKGGAIEALKKIGSSAQNVVEGANAIMANPYIQAAAVGVAVGGTVAYKVSQLNTDDQIYVLTRPGIEQIWGLFATGNHPLVNGKRAYPEMTKTEVPKKAELSPKVSQGEGSGEHPNAQVFDGVVDDLDKCGPVVSVLAGLTADGKEKGAQKNDNSSNSHPTTKIFRFRNHSNLRSIDQRSRNFKHIAHSKPTVAQPKLAAPSTASQSLSFDYDPVDAHSNAQQVSAAIDAISQDAQQIFEKYAHDVNIKAYHDATQRMCDAANALNAQGRSGQAQAATDLALATKEAGKVKINAGNQSAAFVSAMEGKAEQEGCALVVKAFTNISKLGDSVSRSMRSTWQNFKAQPNKDKAVALAGAIATGLGVASGAGITPAIAIGYGQIIANELIAIGDKIGSMIPFSSAPFMSGLQKVFDVAPKCAHGLLARTAPHATVSGPNLAVRVWNGASPLVQRLSLETWAMDGAAVQAEANAAASVTQATQGIFSIGSRLGKLSDKIMDEAVKYVMTDNKIRHIFEKSRHNLNFLVEKLGGREATVREILKAGQGKLPASGVFNDVPLEVSGSIVYVRGAVINGVPKLGTFFVK